jgi:ubiquinone/menaquinone biosynthesis C-methylase UbiE
LRALADASASAVVSVETIEHVPEPDRALAEFRRVLMPGGALFITTPDATGRPGTSTSAYHVREYDRAEFEACLRRYFSNVAARSEHGYLVALCQP